MNLMESTESGQERAGVTELTVPAPEATILEQAQAQARASVARRPFFDTVAASLLESLDALSRTSRLSEAQRIGAVVAACFWAGAMVETADEDPRAVRATATRWLEIFALRSPDVAPYLEAARVCLRDGDALSEPERIFRDAIASLDARKDFEDYLALRHGLYSPEGLPNADWIEREFSRLRSQRFFTFPAQARFGKRLERNLQALREMRLAADGAALASENQRATLSVFRSLSRNMVEMIALADRKAGLLLSANAISLTVLVSFFGRGFPEGHRRLWVSATLIAGTCAITVIFASLAARPVRRPRETLSLPEFGGLGLSFFHYGDIARLELADFVRGFRQTSNDPRKMEDAFLYELHFYSRRIVEKFRMVRRAYLTMITGIVLSCVALLFSHYL